MSVFSDRRPFSKIGGLRAYLRQIRWSVGWRLRLRARSAGSAAPGPSRGNGRRRSAAAGDPVRPGPADGPAAPPPGKRPSATA